MTDITDRVSIGEGRITKALDTGTSIVMEFIGGYGENYISIVDSGGMMRYEKIIYSVSTNPYDHSSYGKLIYGSGGGGYLGDFSLPYMDGGVPLYAVIHYMPN